MYVSRQWEGSEPPDLLANQVVAKGKGKPFRLHYHPKAVLGDPFAKEAMVGKEAVVEIVPVRAGDKVKFLVVAGGKPLADAEVFLRKPGALETTCESPCGNTITSPAASRIGGPSTNPPQQPPLATRWNSIRCCAPGMT